MNGLTFADSPAGLFPHRPQVFHPFDVARLILGIRSHLCPAAIQHRLPRQQFAIVALAG